MAYVNSFYYLLGYKNHMMIMKSNDGYKWESIYETNESPITFAPANYNRWRLEIIEGKGGNDFLCPNQLSDTIYLYYLDGVDNGHDMICDYAGEDSIYIIGENAKIENVRVKYSNQAWNIYYNEKLIVSWDAAVSTKESLTIVVAKSAIFNNTFIGEISEALGMNSYVGFKGVSSFALKLPRTRVNGY